MENQIKKLDPKEFGLDEEKATQIENAFLPKIQEREAIAIIYNQIITSEITPELCSRAKDLAKKLVKVRTGIAEIHKTEKAFSLAYGRLVDAWKNKETLPIEQMEENLEILANHYVNIEKEKIAQLEAQRKIEVLQFTEYPANGLANMEEAVYQAYLTGVKVAYESKLEAEREAEEERIAKEKAEAEERERIRLENERLRKEAEEKEKQLAAERKKAAKEREIAEEKARKEREEAARKLQAEQEAARIAQQKADAERAKLQAEIQAKKDAEIAEQKRLQQIEIEKQKEAEKLAKAPIKKQLDVWVNSFSIPQNPIENNEVSKQIVEKFESFKKWSLQQINNL